MALTDIDRNLLNRCLNNEPGAWKDFVDRFVGLFVHVIHHSAHSRSVRVTEDDVQDLCSEIFVTLLANDYAVLRRFRGQCSLATYLTVIARRIAVKEIARRRMAEALGHVTAHQVALDHAHVGDREQQRIENQEEVHRMLSGLNANEAEVVRQFHLEGKSYREISARLGISENSIGPTLTRARERLRQQEMQT